MHVEIADDDLAALWQDPGAHHGRLGPTGSDRFRQVVCVMLGAIGVSDLQALSFLSFRPYADTTAGPASISLSTEASLVIDVTMIDGAQSVIVRGLSSEAAAKS